MSRKPVYPSAIPRPFADSGASAVVPDVATTPGRASYTAGFPEETQLPMKDGGIAPNRTDFNGIFKTLSAFAFWQQSGGMFSYNPDLGYPVPSLVVHDGKVWWCLQPNGPEEALGTVEPGTDEDVWVEFLRALSSQSGGDTFSGVPVGTIIMYYGTTAPEGYFPCENTPFSATENPKLYALLGRATTPDMRGLYVRGYDPGGIRDANGVGRAFGSLQTDAIRNITGMFGNCEERQASFSGAFVPVPTQGGAGPDSKGGYNVSFDASRVVPTAGENRGKNINLLYAIKHD